MLFIEPATSNNSSKDASKFALSCSFADDGSNIAFYSGIAVAVSVFFIIICSIMILWTKAFVGGKNGHN